MTQRIRRSLRPVHYIFAALLMWVAMSSWARGMIWASYQLAAHKNSVVVVLADTGSMEPTYDTRDILIVQPCPSHEIGAGDVVSFKLPEKYAHKYGVTSVLHRVIGTTKDGWVTKGDNNETRDEWIVQADWLRGKVIADHRI